MRKPLDHHQKTIRKTLENHLNVNRTRLEHSKKTIIRPREFIKTESEYNQKTIIKPSEHH